MTLRSTSLSVIHIAKLVPAPAWFINLGIGPKIIEAVAAKSAWPNAKIVGVEPDPVRFQTHLGAYPGKLLPYAISDSKGRQDFYVDPSQRLWSCFGNGSATKISVPAMQLDDLSEGWGPFENAVVWADIEGSEAAMLRGAEKLIKAGAITAFHLEVRPDPKYDGWCSDTDVAELLEGHGFKMAHKGGRKGRASHYDVIYTK